MIEEIRKSVLARLRKDFNARAFSPSEFSLFCQSAARRRFNSLCGLPESYLPSNPATPMAYEVSGKISQKLSSFKTKTPFPIPVFNGTLELPNDFAGYPEIEAVFVSSDGQKRVLVELVTDSEFSVRKYDFLETPTRDYPITRYLNGKMEILPADINFVDISYLRLPVDPFWDFVVVSGQESYLPEGQVHNGTGPMPQGTPSRSVDFDFPLSEREALENIVYGLSADRIQDAYNKQIADNNKASGV
jgi:hypothetical protein